MPAQDTKVTSEEDGPRRRVCLLTGASGRLGRAFCARYAGRYDIVAVHAWSPLKVATQDQEFVDPLDTAREIPRNAHRVFAVRADLTDDAAVVAVVETALHRFGRIDLLVNAAAYRNWGPLIGGAGNVVDTAAYQLTVNAVVPIKLSRAVAEAFWTDRPAENRASNRNVVNLSSTAGSILYPDGMQSVYAASKAALNQLTRHMASEYDRIGVRVNALAPNTFPGIVTTESVLEALVDLDSGRRTGEIRIVDREDVA